MRGDGYGPAPLALWTLVGWSGDYDHLVGDIRPIDQASTLCIGDVQHNGQFGQALRG